MYSLLKSILIFLSASSICVSNVMAYNYFCSKDSWCKKGKHLMCDTSSINKEGKFERHAPLTFKFRRTLLEQHNKFRDTTAGTKKATRMRNLIWDHELAYLARTHTRLCPDKASECHRTARFEKVGINTDIQGGASSIELNTVITTAMQKWQADGSTSMTVMTHDQASRVGCAIGYCKSCKDDKKHCYFISCFYDMDNIDGVQPQETGDKAASKCNTWDTVQDKKYKNLCHNTEKKF